MRQVAALLSLRRNGFASDYFWGGKRGRRSESSKQAGIAQAVRPTVSDGLVCSQTHAAGCFCPGHWLSPSLRDVAAQPCRGGVASSSVYACKPLWTRGPACTLTGLERCQPHLCQTPYSLSPHLD